MKKIIILVVMSMCVFLITKASFALTTTAYKNEAGEVFIRVEEREMQLGVNVNTNPRLDYKMFRVYPKNNNTLDEGWVVVKISTPTMSPGISYTKYYAVKYDLAGIETKEIKEYENVSILNISFARKEIILFRNEHDFFMSYIYPYQNGATPVSVAVWDFEKGIIVMKKEVPISNSFLQIMCASKTRDYLYANFGGSLGSISFKFAVNEQSGDDTKHIRNILGSEVVYADEWFNIILGGSRALPIMYWLDCGNTYECPKPFFSSVAYGNISNGAFVLDKTEQSFCGGHLVTYERGITYYSYNNSGIVEEISIPEFVDSRKEIKPFFLNRKRLVFIQSRTELLTIVSLSFWSTDGSIQDFPEIFLPSSIWKVNAVSERGVSYTNGQGSYMVLNIISK